MTPLPLPAAAALSRPPPRRSLPLAVETVLFRHQRHLPWVHGAMMAGFAVLIFLPPLLPEPAPGDGPLDHLVPFANLALWGAWFPLVLLSVIATGRSWCGLFCPMGAASEAASRRGLKRKPPRWLVWPGTPVVSFVVVTVLGQTTGVRSHPEAAAEIFGGTMAAAIVLGFLFSPGKRPWCRHACPIGLLLGVFSRLGAVEFAPKRPEPGGDRWTDRGVCPTMIDLKRKTESRHCIECLRCISPKAPGGLAIRFRRPGAEIEDIAARNPNPSELLFLFLGGGVALGGFLWGVLGAFTRWRDALGEWAIDRDIAWLLTSGPGWLMSVHPERREVFLWLDFVMIVGFMGLVMVAFAAVLATATAAAAALAGALGGRGTLGSRFLALGYQFAPVAMVSLLIGLGGGLFQALAALGLPVGWVAGLKAGLFAVGGLWSLWLGWKILAAQGIPAPWRPLPLAPGLVATAAAAAAWAPAVL
ncbi:MAG: 4Fe-4S binding protein [Magnetospirillum sp.]|nr:4Fe-4S binding protein [Magnetospirillum sp.]